MVAQERGGVERYALGLSARTPHEFNLAPFEVLTLELEPK
jgi:hypothetical protein